MTAFNTGASAPYASSQQMGKLIHLASKTLVPNKNQIQPGITIGVDPKTMTPQDWLNVLTRRVDFGWVRIELLRAYVDGNAPMPELQNNTREAWQKFQREARTNWGALIIESVVNRIIPNGITVDGDANSKLAKQAQQIWRRNRMDAVFRQWVRFGLIFRQSYLTVWLDDSEGVKGKKALITADSPESMGVSLDPLQPWKCRAAVRWWRDLDLQEDRALVWGHTSNQQFKRTLLSLNAPTNPPNNMMYYLPVRLLGQWDPVKEPDETGEPPPVVVYNNPGWCGEFETHIDVINRINREVLERLSTSAMQAFRQRAVEGGLPQVDRNGNQIDWGVVFEPAPGAIWDLPEGTKIWESQPYDMGPMLDACKDDIRQLSAATRTPFPVLMPDNANQTAEGADAARDGHIFKCGERLVEAKSGIEAALEMALITEGADLGEPDTDDYKRVEVLFKPVDRVTIAEMYAAAQAASSAGESWQSIARNILGYSPEQIAQDELDKLQEAMRAAAFAPPPPMPNADIGIKYKPIDPNKAAQKTDTGAYAQTPPTPGQPAPNVGKAAQASGNNPNPRQAVKAGTATSGPGLKVQKRT